VDHFVLWKARKPVEPFWPSQLGGGRPGCHIEDPAISERLLGGQYDLRGGAIVTIRDALATASTRAIPFAFFSSHYRSQVER
jgi:cysteinyl-tRNA synthetase